MTTGDKTSTPTCQNKLRRNLRCRNPNSKDVHCLDAMALLGTYSFHGSGPTNGCRFILERLEALRADVNMVRTARRSFRGSLYAGLGGTKGN